MTAGIGCTLFVAGTLMMMPVLVGSLLFVMAASVWDRLADIATRSRRAILETSIEPEDGAAHSARSQV